MTNPQQNALWPIAIGLFLAFSIAQLTTWWLGISLGIAFILVRVLGMQSRQNRFLWLGAYSLLCALTITLISDWQKGLLIGSLCLLLSLLGPLSKRTKS